MRPLITCLRFNGQAEDVAAAVMPMMKLEIAPLLAAAEG
jgi:hypothetical protein